MEKNTDLIGKRVKITQLFDPYINLKDGDEGTIKSIEKNGEIIVYFDKGITYSISSEIDDFEVIEEAHVYKFSQFISINESKSEDMDYLKEKMIEFSELFLDLESKFNWEIQDDDIIIKVGWGGYPQGSSDYKPLDSKLSSEIIDYYYEWVINIDEERQKGLVKINSIFSSNIEDLEDEAEELYFSSVEQAVQFIQDELQLYIQHNESIEYTHLLEKKNTPTNPKLWAACKSWAKSRYEVWPSAYAVGAAAKRYKSRGGGWKKSKTKKKSRNG